MIVDLALCSAPFIYYNVYPVGVFPVLHQQDLAGPVFLVVLKTTVDSESVCFAQAIIRIFLKMTFTESIKFSESANQLISIFNES